MLGERNSSGGLPAFVAACAKSLRYRRSVRGRQKHSSIINLLQGIDGSAVRLKFGYLCQQASGRLGHSVYSRAEKQQAQAILHELDRHYHHHYWLRTVTLESAHRLASTHWLKRFLDSKAIVIYLDTDLLTRQARSLVTLDALESNDEIKRGRGAHKLKGIADIILENVGSTAEELMEELAEKERSRG